MERVTKYQNDIIRNRAVSILRKLDGKNGLNGDELGAISAFCLIERTENRILKEYEDLEEQGKLSKDWIPADKPPTEGRYILLSFANFPLPLTGRYEEDSEGGAYYIGDDDESCTSQDMVVNGWMPLPMRMEGGKGHGN